MIKADNIELFFLNAQKITSFSIVEDELESNPNRCKSLVRALIPLDTVQDHTIQKAHNLVVDHRLKWYHSPKVDK